MNEQFGKIQAVDANIIHLVPSVISNRTNKSLEELTSFYHRYIRIYLWFYSDDLRSVSLAPTEV